MEILIFNEDYVETAHCLEIRTGLKIVTGDWKPDSYASYIVYGADKQIDIINKVKTTFGCAFIIINDIPMKEWTDEYEKLLKTNIVLEQEIQDCVLFTQKGITTQYFVNEFFYNKAEDIRPTDYLLPKFRTTEYDCYAVGECEEQYERESDETYDKFKTLIGKASNNSIQLSEKMSVNQKTEFYNKSKTYLSIYPNDWLNINKAIACGCKVISCMEHPDMMKIYEPFILFKDINDDNFCDNSNFDMPVYEVFQNTILTYGLNKYLPLIKEVYVKNKERDNSSLHSGENKTDTNQVITSSA